MLASKRAASALNCTNRLRDCSGVRGLYSTNRSTLILSFTCRKHNIFTPLSFHYLYTSYRFWNLQTNCFFGVLLHVFPLLLPSCSPNVTHSTAPGHLLGRYLMVQCFHYSFLKTTHWSFLSHVQLRTEPLFLLFMIETNILTYSQIKMLNLLY